MSTKTAVHTFKKGMVKDLDFSLLSNEAYLNSTNFRIVTSVGESTGALENIEGNHLINTGINDICPDGHYIVGSCLVRDSLILFTTDNTSDIPSGGNSRIIKVEFDEATETLGTVTLLYDDNLNKSTGYLNFSTAHLIKAVGRYETPNVQKVYWTDGYNNLRYANIADNLTITGDPYSSDDYMAPEMFELLPLFNSSKVVLKDIVNGHLNSGSVQYSYQLYRNHGASTSFAPVSNMIHVVTDSDFKSDTTNYSGDSESIPTGKGFKLEIDNDNIGYNRLRLVRIHYSSLNSVPSISIVAEIEIDTDGGIIEVIDTGEIVSSLTIEEFNIMSTDLFTCDDIATKNNRLFAANLESNSFDIGDFDPRAVRFNNYTALLTQYVSPLIFQQGDGGATFSRVSPSEASLTILNFSLSHLGGATIENVVDIVLETILGYSFYGDYTNSDGGGNTFNFYLSDLVVKITSYDKGTDTIVISIKSKIGDIFDHTRPFYSLDNCILEGVGITYSYLDSAASINAVVYDGDIPTTITQPASDSVIEWENAGWTEANFPIDHDAINYYNDTDNDGDNAYAYKYCSDGFTLGAEGINVKIDFDTEPMVLDNSNVDTKYSATIETGGSYSNFASPWNAGELSWQRDEVYRLFVVWENNRGQKSQPQWIIDLRMPSLHETTSQNCDSEPVLPFGLAQHDSGTGITTTYLLRPRIYFKSFPTDAVSCQIYRVVRERSDRSVVTQGIAVPTLDDLSGTYRPDLVHNDILTTDSVELIKLVSPEINITKNIKKQANDYIEHVSTFEVATGQERTSSTIDSINRITEKLTHNTTVPFTSDTRSAVGDALNIGPSFTSDASDIYIIEGKQYNNYYYLSGFAGGKGCTGLLISYENQSWSAEGNNICLVNYKSKVYGSQYGGNTYEARQRNVSIPCSDIIYTAGLWSTIKGGDTFINYMEVSTMLYDLLSASVNDSRSEVLYFPVESSINCDLRHDRDRQNITYNTVESALRQEYSGTHTVDTTTYIQKDNLYLYNTVYSQETSIQNAIAEPLDSPNETVFDCIVKASRVKYNGENSDSWTKFGFNEEIEVDSKHGEITALTTLNDKLLFWQEHAFGVLSVNERSLISDTSTAPLVLGTGGVLDRYDYVSDSIGTSEKRSIITGQSGVYWFDVTDKSIYKFASSLDNLTKSRMIQSWVAENHLNSHIVHSIYDNKYNEVLFTFYDNLNTSYTLVFNESINAFSSFYGFTPRMYVPYINGYFSTYFDSNADSLYWHNSLIEDRNCFYGASTGSSTLKLLCNDDYAYTKVFDNFFYDSKVYSTSNIEQHQVSFTSLRCYNNLQNTGTVNLSYGTNLERREREWTTFIPRNAISVDYPTNVDIFDVANLDPYALYRDRMRDKYLVVDLTFVNSNGYRMVFPYFGIKYRLSYR